MIFNNSSPSPYDNKTYTPINSQSFQIPFDSYTGMFSSNGVTRSSDYTHMGLECSEFTGVRLQFEIEKYVGY